MRPEDVRHHDSCKRPTLDSIETMDLGDGYSTLFCVECGAQVNDLPDKGDPYWDDAGLEDVR